MAWYRAPARAGRARAGRIRVVAAGLLGLALGACDFPTEAPIFESRFLIPAEQTTLGIDELLPPQLGVVGSDLALTLPGTQLTRSLAELCGANCALIPPGTSAPKPAFTSDLTFSLSFPADVQAAIVSGGWIRLELSHTFGFDPLANGGYIRTVIRSNNRIVARDSLAGPFTGATLTRDLQLDPGTLGGDLVGTITLHSPARLDPVTYQPNASLSVRVAPGVPGAILISEATVRRPQERVSVADVQLDLTDIDETMAERVRSGTMVLDISNPFNAGGTLELVVRDGGSLIASRQIVIAPCAATPPCTTSYRIAPAFTTTEIQSMLGRDLTLSVSGLLSTGASFVTVRADQQIDIDTQLDLTLRVGGDE